MKQVQIKLTDEERTDAIYQPVCQNAAATAIVDTLIEGVSRMEGRAKTQNPRPDLQSVPQQIRKKVKANLYKHFQALSSRMQIAAPSHVTTCFRSNF